MKLDRIKPNSKQPLNCLYLSEKEALSIIKSLTSQLLSRNSNVGRSEFYTIVNGEVEYFSIFVVDEKEST